MNTRNYQIKDSYGNDKFISIRLRDNSFWLRFRNPDGKRIERKICNASSYENAKNIAELTIINNNWSIAQSNTAYTNIVFNKNFYSSGYSYPAHITKKKNKDNFYGRIKVFNTWVTKSLKTSNKKRAIENLEKLFLSFTRNKVWKKIEDDQKVSNESKIFLLHKNGESYKNKILSKIKDTIENPDELTKYRTTIFLKMKKDGNSNSEICKELNIDKSSLRIIISRLNLQEIKIPNYKKAHRDEEKESCLANQIDYLLGKGFTLRNIKQTLNISDITYQEIIYKWLINNENI